jgi:cytochrome b6-f complex iron-sulfur subunit
MPTEESPAKRGQSGINSQGRRSFVEIFLSGGLLASLASFLYPVFRYMIPPRTADLGKDTVIAARVGELKRNEGKIFPFGSKPALLVMTGDGQYRAMSAICTHLNCTVQYRADVQHVWCACHNGHYDLNGRNISGPPPRPLELYDVNVHGQEIFVSRRGRA